MVLDTCSKCWFHRLFYCHYPPAWVCQARITHLPPDAVAGRQRSHYPFTPAPDLPQLLPNPSLHETQAAAAPAAPWLAGGH